MTCEYTPEVADIICARLASGMTLPKALAKTSLLPYEYYQWRRTIEEFAKQTENARTEGSHAYVDEAIDIADNCPPERDAVALAALRIKTRLRMAELLNPKRYAIGVSSGGGGTVQVLVVTGVPDAVGAVVGPAMEALPSRPST